jgi:hypothetical protein
MTVKLDLKPEVEASLSAKAQSCGLSLEAYLDRVLQNAADETVEDGFRGKPVSTRARIAGQRIREIRKGMTLGGISIQELINEGRV